MTTTFNGRIFHPQKSAKPSHRDYSKRSPLYKSANPNPLFSFGRWKKDKAGDFNEEKLLKKEMSFDFLKGGGKIEKIAKMSPVEYDMVCIA